RFPGVVDRGAGVCSREKLGLVQFNGPSPELHPVFKAPWGVARVAAFAPQEITQTKLCRINVHRASDSVSLANVCTDGVSQQNRQFSRSLDSLRVSPLLP